MRQTNVYKVTLLVIDHEHMGKNETRVLLENMRYLFSSVLKIETAEVPWTDDHPLNLGPEEQAQAVAELFPPKDKE